MAGDGLVWHIITNINKYDICLEIGYQLGSEEKSNINAHF
jgi:hypothetical protein